MASASQAASQPGLSYPTNPTRWNGNPPHGLPPPNRMEPMNTLPTAAERRARALLATIADPGDRLLATLLTHFTASDLAGLLRRCNPTQVADICQLTAERLPTGPAAVTQRLRTWVDRMDTTPEPDLEAFTEAGGQFLVPGDFGYPAGLNDLGDRPIALWTRGRLRLGDASLTRAVAVVGSRPASAATPSVSAAAGIARGLSDEGWAILTDAETTVADAASTGVIADKGAAAAVLGSGLDAIGSTPHPSLANRVGAEGVLISEMACNTGYRTGYVPARARIMAAWPLAVLVAFALDNDLADHTARLAAELGRSVMVVRGWRAPVASPAAERLITEGLATAVRTLEDVLAHLPTDQ